MLEDIPKDATLVQVGAYYRNDHEDGLGVMLVRSHGFSQPLPLFDGSTEDALALIDGFCRRKASLTDSDKFDFAMLVLSLELRGEIEPSEFNGCALAFIADRTMIMASGSAPDADIIGGKFVSVGRGPSIDLLLHVPDEEP